MLLFFGLLINAFNFGPSSSITIFLIILLKFLISSIQFQIPAYPFFQAAIFKTPPGGFGGNRLIPLVIVDRERSEHQHSFQYLYILLGAVTSVTSQKQGHIRKEKKEVIYDRK